MAPERYLLCASMDSNLAPVHRLLLRGVLHVGSPPVARVLSLQLLQNCLIFINTILVERTVERQKLWPRLKREDIRGLTPLFYNRINPYGTFRLDLNRRSFLDVA